MKIIRFLILMLCAVVSIAAQTALRPGEVLTTPHPNFSPDGKYIVFSSNLNRLNSQAVGVKDEISGGLRLMNSDDSGMRVVTPNTTGVFDRKASVSYDNSKIVFIRQTGSILNRAIDVYVVNVDGKRLKRITRTSDHEDHPAFTADGKEVVCVRQYPEYGSFTVSRVLFAEKWNKAFLRPAMDEENRRQLDLDDSFVS